MPSAWAMSTASDGDTSTMSWANTVLLDRIVASAKVIRPPPEPL